ncbi:uncharacterized protein [Watersipora subatra]|uniref:uncharacterized protein n=1 Tax=Watersipora subatra TaxID=2589382 RepID=UPI00355BFB08
MQRVHSWCVLRTQARILLKTFETGNTGGFRASSSGPVLTCAQERPIDPISLFLCEPDGLTPISEDAHKIYEDNKPAIEQHVVQRLLPSEVSHRVRKAARFTDSMSDQQGIISNCCVQLGISHQSKSRQNLKSSEYLHLMSSLDPEGSQSPSAETPSDKSRDSHLPSQEKLEEMKAKIAEMMPDFFRVRVHQYSLYTVEVQFENNYWGRNEIYKGINAYATELLKLRTKCNIAYCGINLYIINISSNAEDGSIRVRWTMKCIPQFEGFKFWKFNLFNLRGKGGVKEKLDKTVKVHDGVNTFWLNKDGAIYRHRLDKVIPDDEKKVASTAAVNKITSMLNKSLAGATDRSNSPSDKFRSHDTLYGEKLS